MFWAELMDPYANGNDGEYDRKLMEIEEKQLNDSEQFLCITLTVKEKITNDQCQC